jgi:hypothetical protein
MTRAVIPVHILIPSSGKLTLKSPITNVGRAVGCVVVAVGLLEGKVVDSFGYSKVGLLEAVVGLDVDVVVAYLLGLADGLAVDAVALSAGVRVNVVGDLLGLAGLAVDVVGVSVILDVMGDLLGLADGLAVGVDDVINLLGLAVGVDIVGDLLGLVVGVNVMGLVVVGVAVVGLAENGIDDKGRFVVG